MNFALNLRPGPGAGETWAVENGSQFGQPVGHWILRELVECNIVLLHSATNETDTNVDMEHLDSPLHKMSYAYEVPVQAALCRAIGGDITHSHLTWISNLKITFAGLRACSLRTG